MLYTIIDRFVFDAVRRVFGGKLRFAISGGAPLQKHIAIFFESLGMIIVEGYGLTETSPIITSNSLDDYRFGSVGKVLPQTEINIDETGEILMRGPGLMKGYYKAPETTVLAIDGRGWFHTGDMGFVDKEGFVTIIGRLKELIILSTGRNIAPEPLEQALEDSKYIKQAMVYGDKERNIAAIIVPDFKNLETWCTEHSVTYELPKVLKNTEVNKMYSSETDEKLKHFQTFEQVKNFQLIDKEFTIENEMLTPTLKMKRGNILFTFLNIGNKVKYDNYQK